MDPRVAQEVARLQQRLEVLKSHRDRLLRLEDLVLPHWASKPYACPDGWINAGYNTKDRRLNCRPPMDGTTPGNQNCNFVATFPKIYDRCGWSMHCRARWTKFGCFDGDSRYWLPEEGFSSSQPPAPKVPRVHITPAELEAARRLMHELEHPDKPHKRKHEHVFNSPEVTPEELEAARRLVHRLVGHEKDED